MNPPSPLGGYDRLLEYAYLQRKLVSPTRAIPRPWVLVDQYRVRRPGLLGLLFRWRGDAVNVYRHERSNTTVLSVGDHCFAGDTGVGRFTFRIYRQAELGASFIITGWRRGATLATWLGEMFKCPVCTFNPINCGNAAWAASDNAAQANVIVPLSGGYSHVFPGEDIVIDAPSGMDPDDFGSIVRRLVWLVGS